MSMFDTKYLVIGRTGKKKEVVETDSYEKAQAAELRFYKKHDHTQSWKRA